MAGSILGTRVLRTEDPELLLGQAHYVGDLAAAHGTSLNHLAIQWTLRSPAVTSSIIGARTVAQLDDSLDALQSPMPDEAMLAAIDAIAPCVKKKHAEG